ncbi:MAG: stage II sporulation protein M [Polaromonas sp.]|nr:stage II sporulation protein M [Polaromonas sp.]
MTPLQFEQLHEAEWSELASLLKQLKGSKKNRASIDGHRLAQLYRRTCEQLAMARERAYPVYQIDHLQQLTADAHQIIYQQHELGLQRLIKLFAVDFPAAVRAHSVYVWIATLVFIVPTLVMGVLVYLRPELILSVMDAEQAARFAEMYSDSADTIGRMREADGDWKMFGFYIKNNVGVSFQCFASGLFAGIGSLFFLAFNGVLGGAVAGHLSHLGLSRTFYSFVVTHSAFELTAIILSGAAGLRIGHALLAPKNLTRVQALVKASRESIVIVYGVIAMLIIAAAIEAFWSSARWIPLPMKYSVAAICWTAVIAYLTLQGRNSTHAG